MTDRQTTTITDTLSKKDVHAQWEDHFRTPENERFYSEAFDFIAQTVYSLEHPLILDAGCGIGAHSVRLAQRGFQVVGVDFSELILGEAKSHVASYGLEDKIYFQKEDLLSLSFPDNRFDCILAWGVLMHIHEIDKAGNELARVLKPGGSLILSEGNMYSLESIAYRLLRRFIKKGEAPPTRTRAGMEFWQHTSAGTLLTRHSDIKELCRMFDAFGLTLTRRTAGQLTEAYMRFSSPMIAKFFHWINDIWFKYVRVAQPAFGNLLFFKKRTVG